MRLSGRVLYALTHFPTGAIMAAPTTSLPEAPGGTRNWDYRYAWVRDASFTLQALWVAACPDEADRFFEYMAGTSASQVRGGADLVVYSGGKGIRGPQSTGLLVGRSDLIRAAMLNASPNTRRR